MFNLEIYADKDLYLFYLRCLSGGLRIGEARAIRPQQILFDKKALIVDGTRTKYNKKGTEEHPKLRIVPLPDITLNLLKEHIEERRVAQDDFIFKGRKLPDKPITVFYVHDNLKRIIRRFGTAPFLPVLPDRGTPTWGKGGGCARNRYSLTRRCLSWTDL